MFIAHLPAGYLLSRRATTRRVRVALLVGSVLPDLDLLWFYLVDHGAVHHHRYVPHIPLLWGAVLVVGLALRRAFSAGDVLTGLGVGGLFHVVLDTAVGHIMWLWPWSDEMWAIWTVTRRFEPWWLNFLLHESFGLEIALCLAALMVWKKSKQNKRLAATVP